VAVHFAGVTLHAVSRDGGAHPRPCLYCQVDAPGEGAGEGDAEGFRELRLVPATDEALAALYDAFCEGVALNPDSDASSDEGGEGSGMFFDVEEVAAGALGGAGAGGAGAAGAADGADGRFDDA